MRPATEWAGFRPGRVMRKFLRNNGLSLVLLALFAASFVGRHTGRRSNWQSEFFSIWTMIVLSIFLRQKGSPESKAVGSPNSQTGAD